MKEIEQFLANGGVVQQLPYDERAERAARVGRGVPMGAFVEVDGLMDYQELDLLPEEYKAYGYQWGAQVRVECDFEGAGEPITAAEKDAAAACRTYFTDSGEVLDSDEYL